MIRAAGLALLLAPAAAFAGDGADCAALLDRMGAVAAEVSTPGGACFLRDVTLGSGEGAWSARIVALYGDLDALPDATPVRLTGGAWGLVPPGGVAPEVAGAEGDPAGDLNVTFDLASGQGVLRIDRFDLRFGDAADLSITARLEDMPETWPTEPRAMARARIVAFDARLERDGGEGPWAEAVDGWLATLAPQGRAAGAGTGRLDVALTAPEVGLLGALAVLRGGPLPQSLGALAAMPGMEAVWTP